MPRCSFTGFRRFRKSWALALLAAGALPAGCHSEAPKVPAGAPVALPVAGTLRLVAAYPVGRSPYFPRHFADYREFPADFKAHRGRVYLYRPQVPQPLLELDPATGRTRSDSVINALIQRSETHYGGVLGLEFAGNYLYLCCALAVVRRDARTGAVRITPSVRRIMHLLPRADGTMLVFSGDTATLVAPSGERAAAYAYTGGDYEQALNSRDTLYNNDIGQVLRTSLAQLQAGTPGPVLPLARTPAEAANLALYCVSPAYLVAFDARRPGTVLLVDKATGRRRREVALDPNLLRLDQQQGPDTGPYAGVWMAAPDDQHLYILHMRHGVIEVHELAL
jgi:hypothetical protein